MRHASGLLRPIWLCALLWAMAASGWSQTPAPLVSHWSEQAPARGHKVQPSFERAIAVTLKHEGGFVDHPSDPGGATKYGISLRFLQDVGVDIDRDGDVDADDIRELTIEQAKVLYYRKFWSRYDYGSLGGHKVAAKVFDLSVNMGPRQAHKLLQRALRACGARLDDDGILGPITRGAVRDADQDCLLVALRSEAAGFYRYLRKPEFERGWLRRAYS